jgi:FMN phosphatase YigB (HAD superfamily)
MRKFVERLHQEGIATAVASGSSRAAIEAVLAGTGLGAYVTMYVSADEVALGKPAPDVFLEAARRLGAASGDCVVLEDAAPGVAAAHVAGRRTRRPTTRELPAPGDCSPGPGPRPDPIFPPQSPLPRRSRTWRSPGPWSGHVPVQPEAESADHRVGVAA